MPMITPNNPKALPKISMMRILTKVDGVCASARAAPEPVTPTQIPQQRLERPTARPAPNKAYPLNSAFSYSSVPTVIATSFIFPYKIIAMMTP